MEETSNRLHQSKIACFLDETLIVESHLETQCRVLEGLLNCLSPENDRPETSSSRDHFHHELIRNCITNTRARVDSLFELRRKAGGLSNMVSNSTCITSECILPLIMFIESSP